MNTTPTHSLTSESRRRLAAALELLGVTGSVPAAARKSLLDAVASLAQTQGDAGLLSAAMSELHMLKFEGASRDEKIRGSHQNLDYPATDVLPYGP